MTFFEQQTCSACGAVLVDHDRDGSDWECRFCRTVHNTGEVVL